MLLLDRKPIVMNHQPDEILDHKSGAETPEAEQPKRVEPEFAGLTDRIKAVVADGLIVALMMVIASSVFSSLKDVPDAARIFAFVFIFFLYDPLCTSFLGGTAGHYMNGLRVKRESDQKRNVFILLAVIRFLVKAALGWISVITVMNSEKSKAIHDMIAGSVVIYKPKKTD